MIDLEAARRGNENVSTLPPWRGWCWRFIARGIDAAVQGVALEILQKPKQTPIRSACPLSGRRQQERGLEGVRADAGIVYVPARPYVFVAMGTYLREDAAPSGALDQLLASATSTFSSPRHRERVRRQIR